METARSLLARARPARRVAQRRDRISPGDESRRSYGVGYDGTRRAQRGPATIWKCDPPDGGIARGLDRAMDDRPGAGRLLRRAYVPQATRLHCGRGAVLGARHRRLRDHLWNRERRPAAAASGRSAVAADE